MSDLYSLILNDEVSKFIETRFILFSYPRQKLV